MPAADKWALFDDLRAARSIFGLSDRDLTVLTALLSFLPARDLADGADLIVFPSNATLAQRANGMAESTLRRHLAALVDAGMIARHDSPNGKRYATRIGSRVVRAFGFSLRPLLVRAAEVFAAAERVREEEMHLRMTRETVVLALRDATKLVAWLREQGQATANWDEKLEHLRRALRRKMDAPTLERIRHDLHQILTHLQPRSAPEIRDETAEMGGNDSQNERRYQNSEPENHESEPRKEAGRLPLELVLKACPDMVTFAPRQIRNWADLVAAAIYVRAMMGISPDAWDDAHRAMGGEAAAIAVAAILQRMAVIRNPGGYLRSLTSKALTEGFSPGPMIMALLSPANRRPA